MMTVTVRSVARVAIAARVAVVAAETAIGMAIVIAMAGVTVMAGETADARSGAADAGRQRSIDRTKLISLALDGHKPRQVRGFSVFAFATSYPRIGCPWLLSSLRVRLCGACFVKIGQTRRQNADSCNARFDFLVSWVSPVRITLRSDCGPSDLPAAWGCSRERTAEQCACTSNRRTCLKASRAR